MATDLSKTQARPSRGSRSGGGRIDVGSPSVRTKRTSREVQTDTSGASRLKGLETGLNKFFGSQIRINEADADREAVKAAEEYRIQNGLEVSKMKAQINTNFAAFREAVSTGDYTNVVEKPFLDRKVVLDNLQVMTAREQAYRHGDQVRDMVLATPAGEDPFPQIEEFMEANLEGSSPLFDAEYSTIVVEQARKADVERRRGIKAALKDEAREDSSTYALSRLMDGTAVTDYGHIQDVENEVIGRLVAGGLIEAEARLVAGEIVDSQLGQAAVHNPRLIKHLDVKDEDRNNTSWIERNPGAIEQVLAEAERIETATRSREGIASARAIADKLDSFGVPGLAGEGATMSGMLAEIDEWGNQWGKDKKLYRDMRAKYVSQFGANAVLNAQVGMMLNGDDIGALENTEHNKLMDAAEAMLPTMNPAQQENYYSYMATYGPSKSMRDKAKRNFIAGGEQAYQSYLATKPLTESRNLDPEDFYGEELAASYRVLDDLLENGMDVPVALETVFDGREEAGDPSTYYDRMQRIQDETTGGSRFKRGTQKGRRGSFELAKEAWEKLGLPVDWAKAPPAVKVAMQTKINHAAFALRNNGHNEQDIQELAVNLANEIRLVPGKDGLGVTAQDLPRGMPNATPEAQERYEQAIKTLEENDEEGAEYGSPIYDRRSGVDGTYLIPRNGAPSIIPGGTRVIVPADSKDAVTGVMMDVVEIAPGVIEGMVVPGGDDVPVGDGAFLSWSKDRRAWELRGRDNTPAVDDNSVTTSELEYRRQQRMLQEEQAADVDGLYSMIGVGADAPALPPARKAQAEAAERIIRKQSYDTISDGVVSGAIGPMGAKRARAALTQEETVSAEKSAQIVQQARAEVVNELGDRDNLVAGVTDLIAGWEEFRAQSYDDGPSRSVGYGFWLGNADAKERLEDLGYDYNKVKKGTELIAEPDARFLMEQDIQRSLNYVRGKLKEWGRDAAELDNHQLQALIDLHYNGGPKMFGTGLRRSFKSTHWRQAVHDEIKFKSNVTGHKGQQARRNSEANMWNGWLKPDPRR